MISTSSAWWLVMVLGPSIGWNLKTCISHKLKALLLQLVQTTLGETLAYGIVSYGIDSAATLLQAVLPGRDPPSVVSLSLAVPWEAASPSTSA